MHACVDVLKSGVVLVDILTEIFADISKSFDIYSVPRFST